MSYMYKSSLKKRVGWMGVGGKVVVRTGFTGIVFFLARISSVDPCTPNLVLASLNVNKWLVPIVLNQPLLIILKWQYLLYSSPKETLRLLLIIKIKFIVCCSVTCS
jgi:hypothetical protein